MQTKGWFVNFISSPSLLKQTMQSVTYISTDWLALIFTNSSNDSWNNMIDNKLAKTMTNREDLHQTNLVCNMQQYVITYWNKIMHQWKTIMVGWLLVSRCTLPSSTTSGWRITEKIHNKQGFLRGGKHWKFIM